LSEERRKKREEVGKVDIYESKAAFEIFMEILRHFNDVNISWNGVRSVEKLLQMHFLC
jgi:hypothetical protein